MRKILHYHKCLLPLTKLVIGFLDLVSEYQQYQEATADDDEDEDGYDNGYDDEVQEDD